MAITIEQPPPPSIQSLISIIDFLLYGWMWVSEGSMHMELTDLHRCRNWKGKMIESLCVTVFLDIVVIDVDSLSLSTLRRHVIGEFYCATYIFDISFHIQLLLTRLFSMRRLQSGLAGVGLCPTAHTSLPSSLSFSLTHTHFLLLLYVVNLQLI